MRYSKTRRNSSDVTLDLKIQESKLDLYYNPHLVTLSPCHLPTQVAWEEFTGSVRSVKGSWTTDLPILDGPGKRSHEDIGAGPVSVTLGGAAQASGGQGAGSDVWPKNRPCTEGRGSVSTRALSGRSRLFPVGRTSGIIPGSRAVDTTRPEGELYAQDRPARRTCLVA